MKSIFSVISICYLLSYGCTQRKSPSNEIETAPLSPTESIKKIKLQDGYSIELVAAEPMIQDPVAMAWDPNGDLYVAEMNTFMMDAKGTDQHKPYSKVKKLVDENGDGIMDKSTVYIDSLLLPRLLLPIGDEILIQITDTQHIYAYKDTNQDGKADSRRIVFQNNAIDHRNMEHQNGGLVWNLDNWIYPTRDNLRYKYINGNLTADTMYDHMIGQWGMTTDDYGRLYYSEAGPGLPAVQFQQLPQYGALNFSDQYDDDFTIPYPIIQNIDANGAEYALDTTTKFLKRFTSGCGQSIFRGDRLPADMQGDYFIPEPVARIIKRGKIEVTNGKRVIHNAYKSEEWLASSDFNFRPVNSYTGPDGCFYIVDMYRGIIQEGEFADENSSLAKTIKKYNLDKIKGYGRIYRVKHKDFKPDQAKPNLLSKSNQELVKLLNHPNGWWRDNAQQLLIVRNAFDIVSSLEQIILDPASTDLFKIHAIWTLEGLHRLSDSMIIHSLHDKSSRVRKTGIWASESQIKTDNTVIIQELKKLINDTDIDTKSQLYLSLRSWGGKPEEKSVQELVDNSINNELIQYSHKLYIENKQRIENEKKSFSTWTKADKELIKKGEIIFNGFCATCHGKDGKGIQVGNAPMQAPPLAGSPRVLGDKIMLIQIVLHGISGELDGKNYPAAMTPQKHNTDEYIASVLSYLRNNTVMNHRASLISKQEVEDIRITSPAGTEIPNLRLYEIYKLARNEMKNWDSGKPGSNGTRWGGRFLNARERDSIRLSIKK